MARLTEVFRQAAQSRIVVNAHRVNRGQMPELGASANDGGDFFFVEASDADDAARKIIGIIRKRIPDRFGFDPIRDVQVLCPMNRGRLGTRTLNLDLQTALNGDETKPAVERYGWSFRVGDVVDGKAQPLYELPMDGSATSLEHVGWLRISRARLALAYHGFDERLSDLVRPAALRQGVYRIYGVINLGLH